MRSDAASKVLTCPCSRPAIGMKAGSPICAFCSRIETQLELFEQHEAVKRENRLAMWRRNGEDYREATRPEPERVEKPAGAAWLVQGFGNYAIGVL